MLQAIVVHSLIAAYGLLDKMKYVNSFERFEIVSVARTREGKR